MGSARVGAETRRRAAAVMVDAVAARAESAEIAMMAAMEAGTDGLYVGVGLERAEGVRVSRPHLDKMHNDVDELGSGMWFGEVPIGPDGEPLITTVPKTDGELRELRAKSIVGSVAGDHEQSECGAGAGGGVARLAGGAGPAGAAGVAGAAAVAREMRCPACRAESPGLGAHVQVLPDSGAGGTMLTSAVGAVWDGDRSQTTSFIDANGRVVPARGGGEFCVALYDAAAGVWRKESYGAGWVNPTAPTVLGSVAVAQTRALGTHYPAGGGAYHQNERGHVYVMSDAVAHGVHQIMAYVLPSRCGLPSGTVVDVTGLPVVSMMGVVDDRPAGANRLRQVSFKAGGDEDGQSKANVLPASRGHRDTSEAVGEPGKCPGRGSGGCGPARGSVAARDSTIPSTPPSEPEGASQVPRTKGGEELALLRRRRVQAMLRRLAFANRLRRVMFEAVRAALAQFWQEVLRRLTGDDGTAVSAMAFVSAMAQTRAQRAAAEAERAREFEAQRGVPREEEAVAREAAEAAEAVRLKAVAVVEREQLRQQKREAEAARLKAKAEAKRTKQELREEQLQF